VTGQEAGIDLGLESFATLSDGTRILTPGCSRKAERYLAKCYLAKCYLAKCYLAKCYLAKCYLAKCPRRIARRKKGSQRRRKAVCVLAKAYQTVRPVRRQRADFHHKTALQLILN